MLVTIASTCVVFVAVIVVVVAEGRIERHLHAEERAADGLNVNRTLGLGLVGFAWVLTERLSKPSEVGGMLQLVSEMVVVMVEVPEVVVLVVVLVLRSRYSSAIAPSNINSSLTQWL